MTKSMHKLGRKGGRTPFDILRDYETGKTLDEKEQNAILFREFVAAFHGVQQLHWSHGLKKLLAVEEVTDEELAVQEDERPTRLVCELNMAEWKAVRQHHRAALLHLAEKIRRRYLLFWMRSFPVLFRALADLLGFMPPSFQENAHLVVSLRETCGCFAAVAGASAAAYINRRFA